MTKLRPIRHILLWALCLFLLGILLLLLVLRVPLAVPPLPPSAFAKRNVPRNLPALSFEVFETGYSEAPEAYIRQGAPLWATHRMTHSAVVIHHPKANVVLDSGFGTRFREEVAHSSWTQRFFARYFTPTVPLAKHPQFPALDPKRDFFLLSHAHWDHVGGARDFPQIPVKILASEKAFALDRNRSAAHGVFPGQIEDLEKRIVPLTLTENPYENFPQSLDLFNDGSIVLVSLAGHTPGSLGVFVNLNDGRRFLLVGDALWSVDANGLPQARSRLAEWTSDLDKDGARRVRLKLGELIAHSNEVTLIPIHDSVALQKLRPLIFKNL